MLNDQDIVTLSADNGEFLVWDGVGGAGSVCLQLSSKPTNSYWIVHKLYDQTRQFLGYQFQNQAALASVEHARHSYLQGNTDAASVTLNSNAVDPQSTTWVMLMIPPSSIDAALDFALGAKPDPHSGKLALVCLGNAGGSRVLAASQVDRQAYLQATPTENNSHAIWSYKKLDMRSPFGIHSFAVSYSPGNNLIFRAAFFNIINRRAETFEPKSKQDKWLHVDFYLAASKSTHPSQFLHIGEAPIQLKMIASGASQSVHITNDILLHDMSNVLIRNPRMATHFISKPCYVFACVRYDGVLQIEDGCFSQPFVYQGTTFYFELPESEPQTKSPTAQIRSIY